MSRGSRGALDGPTTEPATRKHSLLLVRTAVGVPRDALLAVSLLAAFSLGVSGHQVTGGAITLVSTGAYVAYLAWTRSPRLLYRPQFRHWFGALGLWVLSLVVAKAWNPPVGPLLALFATGAMAFHYACMCVHERTVRYGGLAWRTVSASANPRLYLVWTGFFVLFGIGVLIAPFIVLGV